MNTHPREKSSNLLLMSHEMKMISTFHGLVSHGMETMRSIKHKTNHLDTNYHVTLTISETKSVSLWNPCRPFGFWSVVQPFIFREGNPLVGGWVGSGFAIAKWWLWVHLVLKISQTSDSPFRSWKKDNPGSECKSQHAAAKYKTQQPEA